ncbi:MAG: hypothetical protein LBQ82_00410 [Treponema sp.]|jgi:hypothetical protein|nr:hypothetical protein [Treponema sp.]
MKPRIKYFFLFLFSIFCAPVFSQTHTSIPLNNRIYFILEQAQARGLCSSLPGIRPYTQDVAASAIREILYSDDSEKLSPAEREILEQYLKKFTKPETGMDWQRGAYYNETDIGKSDVSISANLGIGADIQGSAGFYLPSGKQYFGTETWLQFYLNGDISKYVSYNFIMNGGLMLAPRKKLGEYWTFYDGFPQEYETASEYANREIPVYSEPLTHFPYAYKKRWDGSIYLFSGNIAKFESWPVSAAGGYNLLSELTSSFLENKLILRLGRLSHEWGSTPLGSSLSFNQAARPFFGVEAEFSPVSWFSIASLTGALEYYNDLGIKDSSMTFQNLFSVTMLQFRYKNYLFFDFIDAVVYPKRFEPGYISPITNSFFYQNNIGDFDNMAMSFNLMAQYPGIGNVWVSFFMDEMNLTADLLTLDRQMFSWQTGISFPLPILSFSSIKISYTMINPYCYTHNRNYNPWYGERRMETAYVNNGVSLGYYLPPNSDEILFRFETMPVKSLSLNLQYQMIRHGADFDDNAVDGSNLSSELDPHDRNDNPVLKRYFLRDGAYQWSHIIKIGGEWTLSTNKDATPFAVYSEVGTVISYFTNIKGQPNSGKAYNYSIVDSAEYPKSTGIIVKLGIKVFPK